MIDEDVAESAVAGQPGTNRAGPGAAAFGDAPPWRGAEPDVVGPYLAAALHDSGWADCEVALISGGKSNLTYRVHSAAGSLILRRPPLGGGRAGAHDVGREYAVMTALAASPVPVPRTLVLADPSATALGVPFYAMERVLGHVCRDGLPVGYADDEPTRAALGAGLVDMLADLHRLDPGEVGLASLGRPEGFLERQVRRWSRRWDELTSDGGPPGRIGVSGAAGIGAKLLRTMPQGPTATVVHGDYRLDNTILHPSRVGEIAAVLDWEMSTLGDPLADLAMLLLYWPEAGDAPEYLQIQVSAPVSALAGFPSRRDLVERYSARTAIEVADLPWYMAFAFFKVGVILQDVVARAEGGQMLGSGFDDVGSRVAPLMALADQALRTGTV